MPTAELKNQTYSQHSPEFQGLVDKDTIMDTLSNLISSVKYDKSEKNINRIRQELKNWQIMTHNKKDGELSWVLEPIELKNEQVSQPIKHRIGYFIKTAGDWKPKHEQKCTISILSKPLIPQVVVLDDTIKTRIANKTVNVLSVTLMYILLTFEHVLKEGNQLAVFHAPAGIVNMNNITHWYNQNKLTDMTSIENDLQIYDLLDIEKLYLEIVKSKY